MKCISGNQFFIVLCHNLKLVHLLVNVYNLKPRPHDIDIANSLNAVSIAQFLEYIHNEMFMEELNRQEEGYYEKLPCQQIDPGRHDIS